VDYDVTALTVYDGKLIAGGSFTSAGGAAASRVVSWDGSGWSTLGTGLEGGVYSIVYALGSYDGKLVAGGDFTLAGGNSANHIASWDGTSWSVLGSGTNGDVYALTAYDGKLAVGGNFTSAGNKASVYLAQWNKPCCIGRAGDANGEGVFPDEVTLGDVMMMVDAKFISESCDKISCLAEADVNQSGGAEPTCDDITLGDIMILVDFLFINPETAVLPDCL
jgi:hypothetical protein